MNRSQRKVLIAPAVAPAVNTRSPLHKRIIKRIAVIVALVCFKASGGYPRSQRQARKSYDRVDLAQNPRNLPDIAATTEDRLGYLNPFLAQRKGDDRAVVVQAGRLSDYLVE